MLINLVVGHNPDIVQTDLAVYEAAIDKWFDDGWQAHEGIQLYEMSHAVGGIISQAEGEEMATTLANVARTKGFAHGHASGYKAAHWTV